MKFGKSIIAAGAASLLSTAAMGQTVGFAMSEFNDNWLTVCGWQQRNTQKA